MYGIESSSKIRDGFPSSVTDIIQNVIITNGFYRPNRFVVFLPDKYIPGGSNENNRKTIMMNCSAVTVPGMNFSTVERREGAQTFKVPYDYVIEDISMTFNCSDAFLERQYFNYWFSDVFNPAFRCYSYFKPDKNGKKGYGQNFDIVLLSDLAAAFLKNASAFLGGVKEDTLPLEVFHVKIFDAFPKSLSPMNLNYESSDVISTFDVQMSCLNVATSNKIPLADMSGDFAEIYLASLRDFSAKFGPSSTNGGGGNTNLAGIVDEMSSIISDIISVDLGSIQTDIADWGTSVVGDLIAGLFDGIGDLFS